MTNEEKISKSWTTASYDELADELDRILSNDLVDFPYSQEDVRKALWMHGLFEAAKTSKRSGQELLAKDLYHDLDILKEQAPELRGSGKLSLLFSILTFFNSENARRIIPILRHRLIPTRSKLADSLLLLVCKADDAEAATGDLLEELEKVQSRHGKWYCNFWFFWELSLLVILKGRKKLTKSVLGPLADLWKRKSS